LAKGEGIGLAAYRAMSGRGAPRPLDPSADRPDGELVWLHAAEPGSGRANTDLASELIRQRDGLNVLVTTPDPDGLTAPRDVIIQPTPPDHPGTTAAFMRHWQPDVGFWLWGGLRPNLLLSMAALGRPAYFADVSQSGIDLRRDKWLPDVPRQLLTHFKGWMARSDAAKRRLTEHGVPAHKIERLSPMRAMGQTMPAAESDLDEMRTSLGGRPIWFARDIPLEEIDQVLEAHQIAMRITPRLLLILEPSSEDLAPQVSERMQALSLRHVSFGDGGQPTESTQILLADVEDEAGLWYRVSPVTFVGQTFQGTGPTCDPFEPAAHGSAVLYGSAVRAHETYFSRLSQAGAARMVRDVQGLAGAVIQLLAPDISARMAMAAWDVVTEGAEAANRIAELAADVLDEDAGMPSPEAADAARSGARDAGA
jgi:3-deoxy-D-manno-octulosonic-acid transferase